jgi:hypothetical protein
MLTNIIGIILIMVGGWITFEIWRAPLLRENEDGSWTTIKPTKKIKDIFKKKK